MRNHGKGARFAVETLPCARVLKDARAQPLQCDPAPERQIFGFVHHAHGARAQPTQDPVTAFDHLPKGRVGAVSVRQSRGQGVGGSHRAQHHRFGRRCILARGLQPIGIAAVAQVQRESNERFKVRIDPGSRSLRHAGPCPAERRLDSRSASFDCASKNARRALDSEP